MGTPPGHDPSEPGYVGRTHPGADTAVGARSAVESGSGSHERTSQASIILGDVSEADSAWFANEDSLHDEEDPLVGATLSNTYKVNRILGEGGMGRVYEAQHVRIRSKRFAIKALHPEFARRKDVLTRFHREVEAAASIESPHVVGVYDVDQTDDGRPFFVSELLQGEELGDYLNRSGRIGLGFAVKIVRQICKALTLAHEKGVVHRDMKPENVFLSGDVADPVVKVLDFGISRLEGQAGNTLTKTGMVMGTPSYMAPEQAKGLRVDHRVDIYSVGAILYQCVTGRIPFDRPDATATLAAVLTEDPEPPRSIVPQLPEHLELIIQKAMARDADQRYGSMEAFDEALAPYDEEAIFDENTGSVSFGKKAMQPSMTDAARAAREVTDARGQLLVFGGLGAVGILAAVVGVIAGVVRLVRGGAPLTGVEAAVVGLVIAAAISTPMVLIVRHVRQSMWGNTAKVVELVRRLRSPITAAMITYGVMALTVRTVESLFVRNAVGVAWPTWDLLLPLVALLVGLGTFLGRGKDGQAGALDSVRAPTAATGLVVGVLVVAGAAFALRDAPDAEGLAEAVAEAEEKAEKKEAEEEEEDTEETGDADRTRRPKKETKDKKKAFLAWEKVREAIQLGKTDQAVDELEVVLDLDPNAPSDNNVGVALVNLTVRACLKPSETCQKILRLLSEEANEAGLDVLYEIITTKGGTTAQRHAKRLLEDEEVFAGASDALQVAYHIRFGANCDEKRTYFADAVEHGDHRALRELNILKGGRQCRTVNCCLKNDEELDATIQAIKDR